MSNLPVKFNIVKKGLGLARVGVISTPHGEINTPAFVVVGTKATVKALAPEQVRALGAQTVLANTYHLYLEPGDEIVAKAGGTHKFMNWPGPMFTDSGGFQVFSLGAAFGEGGVTKFSKEGKQNEAEMDKNKSKLAKIDDDGVTFKSHLDGKTHRFTPESSIAIQNNLGADIIFAFDECTAPGADYDYQKEAMERTHAWAGRSLEAHKNNPGAFAKQGLFGIVQGGKFLDLRQESAKIIGGMENLAGFGIGGSFSKDDLGEAIKVVNEILPEHKPRHLLGIGEPEDLFAGVEAGVDTFDCVTPTRIARNGTIYTKQGKINILNTKFREDFNPIDQNCACYTCQHYTKSYLAHLFRSKEMFGSSLASIHNLHFIVSLVENIRQAILDDTYLQFKTSFLAKYLDTKLN